VALSCNHSDHLGSDKQFCVAEQQRKLSFKEMHEEPVRDWLGEPGSSSLPIDGLRVCYSSEMLERAADILRHPEDSDWKEVSEKWLELYEEFRAKCFPSQKGFHERNGG